MKICFLLNGFEENGGIGRVVSILANGLSRDEQYRIHTLSFYGEGKPELFPLDEGVQKDLLYHHPITMKKAMTTGGIGKVRRYLKSNQIDVLVACGALYFPLSILACCGLKTRCVSWEHSNITTMDDHAFQRASRWFGAKFGDRVVLLTKKDQADHIGRYKNKGKADQIYNPIDPELYERQSFYSPDSRKIISAGRLTPPKNYGVLVDVATMVLREYPDWQWDIVGEGELRLELDQRIKNAGLEGRLLLKGQVQDLYDRYQEYSFLVLTSLREGFPMVLLEGAANGLPLVSFDIETGPNEIIMDGENGYLIEAFDQPAMIRRIKELIQSRELRLEMSGKSRERSKDFALDRILDQWKQVFRELTPGV